MADTISEALSGPGPHTVESLAARLPDFPVQAIRDAVEALTLQGVLSREARPDGVAEYRLVAPERYAQINHDVVRHPPQAQRRGR
jgi:hypothetical protein